MDILLVEDDPKDIRLMLHALNAAKLGEQVDVVRDGEEALDYLFRRGQYVGRTDVKPKLIVLDLKLPKVNGIEVLRAIKGNGATAAIPVTVLTSSREEKDLIESYKLGANSYIQKPLDFDAFRTTISSLGHYWTELNMAAPEGAFED